MIAAFQSTGAKYGRKNLRWLFKIPSAHADSTSTPVIGNRIRTTAIRSSRRAPSKPGVNTLTSNGASRHAEQRDCAGYAKQQCERGARDAPGLLGAALPEQRRVRGNERRGERALAEQVLQQVREPQAGAEHVGVQAGAEVGREHALAHETDDAAREDA